MGNMQRRRGKGIHPIVRRTAQLVIAGYATVAKPAIPLPGKYIADWSDVKIRVESATPVRWRTTRSTLTTCSCWLAVEEPRQKPSELPPPEPPTWRA